MRLTRSCKSSGDWLNIFHTQILSGEVDIGRANPDIEAQTRNFVGIFSQTACNLNGVATRTMEQNRGRALPMCEFLCRPESRLSLRLSSSFIASSTEWVRG